MPDLRPHVAASSKTRRSSSVVLSSLYTSLHRKAPARFRLVLMMLSAPDRAPEEYLTLNVCRLRKLENWGWPPRLAPDQWIMAEQAEPTLRALGERRVIINRMHRSLTEHGLERGPAGFVLSAKEIDTPITGRLLERGLHEELYGSAYAIVDGIDGRTHHIRFHDL